MFKIGDASLSFVQNSLSTTRNNTGILPASFNTAGFAADVELFAVLTEINTVLAQANRWSAFDPHAPSSDTDPSVPVSGG